MPKIRFQTGQVVNFDGNPTEQDIQEVALSLGIEKAAQDSPKPSLKDKAGKLWSDFKTSARTPIANLSGKLKEVSPEVLAQENPLVRGTFGAAHGLAELAEGMTTPENLGFLGAAAIPQMRTTKLGMQVGRLASGGFAALMGKQVYDLYGAYKDALQRKDIAEAARLGTLMTGTGLFSLLAGTHATGFEAPTPIRRRPMTAEETASFAERDLTRNIIPPERQLPLDSASYPGSPPHRGPGFTVRPEADPEAIMLAKKAAYNRSRATQDALLGPIRGQTALPAPETTYGPNFTVRAQSDPKALFKARLYAALGEGMDKGMTENALRSLIPDTPALPAPEQVQFPQRVINLPGPAAAAAAAPEPYYTPEGWITNPSPELKRTIEGLTRKPWNRAQNDLYFRSQQGQMKSAQREMMEAQKELVVPTSQERRDMWGGIRSGETMRWVSRKGKGFTLSSYPEFFQRTGTSATEVSAIFGKLEQNTPLTPRQQKIVSDLTNYYREWRSGKPIEEVVPDDMTIPEGADTSFDFGANVGEKWPSQAGAVINPALAMERIVKLAQTSKSLNDFRSAIAKDRDLLDTVRFHKMNLQNLYSRRDVLADENPRKKMIEQAGGEYVGLQDTGKGKEPLVLFNDKTQGTTLSLPLRDVTPAKIAAKLKAGEKRFEQVTEPKTTPPELDPLITEARKYKTAEEFIGSQNEGNQLVYHRTNSSPKEFLSGFKSKENTQEIYVSNEANGQAKSYGKNLIPMWVKKEKLRLDDEFPSGEKHYAINKQEMTNALKNSEKLTDIWKKANEKWSPEAGAVINPVEAGSLILQAARDSKTYQEFREKVSTNKDLKDTVAHLRVNLQNVYENRDKDNAVDMARTPETNIQVQKPTAGQVVKKNFETLKTTEGDPIQKVIRALKEAKPLREKQEAIYRKERAKRVAKAMAVGEQVTGEKGFYAEMGQLKGEMAKVAFEGIREKLSQDDIDSLFRMVKDSDQLGIWEKITARGALAKMFGAKIGGVPTEGELKLLNRVFPKEMVDTILEHRPMMEKLRDIGLEVMNLPRSLMASFDLSAPFRQGLFFATRKEFWPAFADMFKFWASEKATQNLYKEIASRPTFPLMEENKLSLTSMDRFMTSREEAFMSNLAEKIPVIGRFVRASNRAYTGFLNKLRADVFDDLYTKAKDLGLNPDDNPKQMKDLANFINNATGRGSLGGLERSAVALNAVFFSPRLMFSRLNLLNPVYYVKLDPFVRKEALKSLFLTASAITTVNVLAKMGGAETEDDPRSADFGKIRIGSTRIDPGGGFLQYIRLASALLTGKMVSSTTGRIMNLGEGYRPMTRPDVLLRALEYKEAPLMSFAVSWMRGSNAIGEKFELGPEVAKRFIPMFTQDVQEVYKDLGLPGLSLVPLGMMGFGLQSYGPRISQEAKNINRFESEQEGARWRVNQAAKEAVTAYLTERTPESRAAMKQALTQVDPDSIDSIMDSATQKYRRENRKVITPQDAFQEMSAKDQEAFLTRGNRNDLRALMETRP